MAQVMWPSIDSHTSVISKLGDCKHPILLRINVHMRTADICPTSGGLTTSSLLIVISTKISGGRPSKCYTSTIKHVFDILALL